MRLLSSVLDILCSPPTPLSLGSPTVDSCDISFCQLTLPCPSLRPLPDHEAEPDSPRIVHPKQWRPRVGRVIAVL